MRKAIFLTACLGIIACADEKQHERPTEPIELGSDSVETTFTRDAIHEDQDNVDIEDETTKLRQEPLDYEVAGEYRKTGADPHLLNVSFTTPTELCISRDEMCILAKFLKIESNAADVYLVEPTDIENAGTDLPWEDFDRNVPVATMQLLPDGSLEFDWIGFSIDGELVTEYALIGKKEMEGTYERL